jgi:N-acetylglucosamine kinase-like BadF-type ATPase
MLLDALLAELGGSSPEDLIERVYAPAMTRERLAGLCILVFDMAEQDPVARTIIDSAAKELASMIAALRSRLGFADGKYPLALAGGTILSQPLLRSGLQEHLHAAGASPETIWLVPDPVRGALTLARSLISPPP